MGDSPKGIYPKTLIANSLLTEEAYALYVQEQIALVNEHKAVIPLFRYLLAQDVLAVQQNKDVQEQLLSRIKKTAPNELLAKIKARNNDLFCKVLSKHHLLEERDIEALQAFCPEAETGMDLYLIALHSGYLPASVIAVAEHKVHEILEQSMKKEKKLATPKLYAQKQAITDGSTERLENLIHKSLKSYKHVALLEILLSKKQDVIDFKEIPALINVDLSTAKSIARDWKNTGIFRHLMGSVYNYGPDPKLQADIRLFFEYWTKPVTKRILLQIINSCTNENRSKKHVGIGRYF